VRGLVVPADDGDDLDVHDWLVVLVALDLLDALHHVGTLRETEDVDINRYNMCVYVYIYIHIYIYLFIYVYVHLYVHIYVYIFSTGEHTASFPDNDLGLALN